VAIIVTTVSLKLPAAVISHSYLHGNDAKLVLL